MSRTEEDCACEGVSKGSASAGVIFIILIASWISRRFSSDWFSAHSLSSAGVGAAFGTPRAANGRVGLTSAGVILSDFAIG